MANDGFNLLIVDGSELNRDSLHRRLQNEGFTCETATNGKQALSMLRAKSFDLVLLEVIMPDLDGHRVLETIKLDRQLTDVAVIMVSAVDDLDSVMRCTELGADDYLTKPFDPVLLRSAIARALKSTPTGIKNQIKPKVTSLQETPKQNPQKVTLADMSLQEAVTEIINTGQLSRKFYMHFSKAIFNGLFSSSSLSRVEYGQINIIFTYLQSGRIKVAD